MKYCNLAVDVCQTVNMPSGHCSRCQMYYIQPTQYAHMEDRHGGHAYQNQQ